MGEFLCKVYSHMFGSNSNRALGGARGGERADDGGGSGLEKLSVGLRPWPRSHV